MGLFLKLLGLVDLAAAACLFLATADIIPTRFVLMVMVAIIGKGLVFWGGPVSMLDLVIGVYVGVSAFASWGLLSTICGIYLLIKGLYSFM